MRRSTVRAVLIDADQQQTPELRRRKVEERIFVELREDARFASLSDNLLRVKIREHLDGGADEGIETEVTVE